MLNDFIPFHLPTIGEDEINEVTAVLRSGWLTSGQRAQRFERDFSRYSGARFALAVNSCTAALHLALVALRIGPGDEVITTPLTFCATVNSILHTGATPVLADVDDHGNIDSRSITARISGRTKAIVPVHLGGRVCDMEAIWRLAEARGAFVIEDAAHAAGSRYFSQPVGAASVSRSQVAAFSFYATKNITTGEGGMAVCNDAALDAHMRSLALHGISKDAWKRYGEDGKWFYEVLEPGFKYNLSDILAAIGIHQLRRIDEFAAARRRIATVYSAAFSDMDQLQPPSMEASEDNSWHLYLLRVREGSLRIGRAEFIEQLRLRGIGASVHFIPIPLHPCYASWARLPRNECPRAMAFYRGAISLPLYPSLTDEAVERVVRAVTDIVVQNQPAMVQAPAARC